MRRSRDDDEHKPTDPLEEDDRETREGCCGCLFVLLLLAGLSAVFAALRWLW